jgi:uncharacterized membrane protein
MSEMTNLPVLQVVFGILVLCVLIAAAFYVVSIFRDYGDKDLRTSQNALANLKEMHLRGDISDEEFRTIEASTRWQSDAVEPSPADLSHDNSKSRSDTEV